MSDTGNAASSIRLDGKVAIVTGAARGLGKAMAEGLAHAGANVMFTDVDAKVIADITRAFKRPPGCGDVAAIPCDITNGADCQKLVDDTLTRFGALHVLVNNAGKGPALLEASPRTRSLKFYEADPDIWREIIITNVNGTYLM